MDFATWGVPALVLVAGAVIGALASRRGTSTELQQARREGREVDLMTTRDSAVEALKALEHERDKLPPDVYEAERARLLREGAEALRALDEAPPSSEPDGVSPDLLEALRSERARLGAETFDAALTAELGLTPTRPTEPGMAPEWRGALWTMLGVGVIGGLFVFMQSSVQDRPEGASMTGNQQIEAPPPPQASAETQAEQARWEEALAANPDDLEALNALTELAFANRDLQKAMGHNSQALAVSPQDPDARVYKAVLRAAVGMVDDALDGLDQVLAERPDHTKALVYKGLLALDADRPAEAVDALERALSGEAGGNPFLTQRLEMARARLAGGPAAGAAPGPMAGGSSAPAAPGEPIATGTISLADGVEARDGVLFVSVRDPAGGPPVAAVKLSADAFPTTFEITTADLIAMGGAPRPVPEPFALSVRLDADGNAMTRDDGDPAAMIGDLVPGVKDVAVVLE